MSKVEFTRKRGMNKGKPRLWIEGAHLTAAGFKRGDVVNVVHFANGFDIIKSDAGRNRIAGAEDRPILDMCGGSLGVVATIPAGALVHLTYAPQSGAIMARIEESF